MCSVLETTDHCPFLFFKKSQNNPLLIPRKGFIGDFSTIYNDIIPKKIKIEDLNNDQLLDLTVLVLQKPYETRTTQDIRLILKTTSNYEYFKTYDKETHEQICRYMTHNFLQKDEILCEIGSKGSTFYIILKGTVEVWVLIPRDIEEIDENGEIKVKNTKVLTHVKNLTVGQSFGELALMENKPRAARIVCADDCDFAVLDKQHFDKILSKLNQKKKKKILF